MAAPFANYGPVASMGLSTDVDTVQRNPVGLVRGDENGNQFIYLPGVASNVAGAFVGFVYTGVTTAVVTLLVTTATYAASVAVSMGATLAANWGWFQIYGFNAAANYATATITTPLMLFTSSTAGRATTSDTAATTIFNSSATVTSVSNVGGVWLDFPYTLGITGASL